MERLLPPGPDSIPFGVGLVPRYGASGRFAGGIAALGITRSTRRILEESGLLVDFQKALGRAHERLPAELRDVFVGSYRPNQALAKPDGKSTRVRF